MANQTKKHHKMEFTPVMMLSMLALFIMMPTIFILANSEKQAKVSRAGYEPTPTPSPVLESEPLEEDVYRVYN